MSNKPDNPNNFWQELKRRKVIGVIIVYVTISAGIIGLISDVYEPLGLPGRVPTLVIIILGIGFPIAVIFAWIFDITLKGIKKTLPIEDDIGGKDIQTITDKASIPEKSIIVLPFENISSDPEQEYFSDGLTEELITQLSYIKELIVISRSSAMTFKGEKKTIKEIAAKVNVKYVLEGSVRKSDNKLRITAQLIDADSDSHLWADTYDGKLDDVFDIQERVSKKISASLKLQLSSDEVIQLTHHPLDNLDAFEYYHKARNKMYLYTEEACISSLEYINKALDIEGENVLLYAAKAEIYFIFMHTGLVDPASYMGKIQETIEKIRELDPESEFLHLNQGLLLWKVPGNINKSYNHFKKALKINPNQPSVLMYFIFISLQFGKFKVAEPYIRKLFEIDPLSGFGIVLTGYYYVMSGKYSKAVGYYKWGFENSPGNPEMYFFLAHGLAISNDKKGALLIIEEQVSKIPDNSWTWLAEFLRAALNGDVKDLEKIVREGLVETAKFDETYSWFMAECYSLLNMKEEAIAWLENAVDRGFLNYPFLNIGDPFLENIRGEERFKTLMKRVKQEWENLDV